MGKFNSIFESVYMGTVILILIPVALVFQTVYTTVLLIKNRGEIKDSFKQGEEFCGVVELVKQLFTLGE